MSPDLLFIIQLKYMIVVFVNSEHLDQIIRMHFLPGLLSSCMK